MVGMVGFEPTTLALSRRCSNQLSYIPIFFVASALGFKSFTNKPVERLV